MSWTFGFRIVSLCAAAAAFTAVNASAEDFISAYGWRTTADIVGSATGASVGSLSLGTCHNSGGACSHANADVTFTTSGVNFGGTGLTVSQWIATNPFAIHNLVNTIPAAMMDPTIWEFTGNISVTSSDPFSIQHDDGATFIVNGQTVVNAAGPTSPIFTGGMYTGPAGTSVPFRLFYTECCGGPAVLNVSLLAPSHAPTVPEPSSIVLLSTVVIGIAIKFRRQRA